MDVPFHSSGAMSRAHYAVVRKVESAPTINSADQHIALEIKSIEAQLSHPKLSIDKCKECLVILLYCSTSVSHGYLPEDVFDFAFPHAINLAETATSAHDKRLGYLFCSEVMPLSHEFRLMLINTLRKDLESEDVPYICLALDNLIASPNEDVIPAVQSRLHDLLSHDYGSVRCRALFAFRSLSGYNQDLLDRIHGAVLKRISDPHESVTQAALILANSFPNDPAFMKVLNNVLKSEASYANVNEYTLMRLLDCLRNFGLAEANVSFLFDLLEKVSNTKISNTLSKVFIPSLFKAIGQIKTSVLLDVEKSRNMSIVQCIRHLLVSRNPNDVHLFISCLEEVDVSIWAGTEPGHPAALEGLEFERILQLLESTDRGFVKKTLRIVNNVDPSILETQISLIINAQPTNADRKATILRVLEIASIRYGQDGSGYAQQVLDLMRHWEQPSSKQVIKEMIEVVLTDIRLSSKSSFVTSCFNKFIAELLDGDAPLGPTALVVIAALMIEYLDSATTSPQQLLIALAARLNICPPVVQEPCLIALIRIRINCNDVPSEVVDIVDKISLTGSKSARLRCAQFREFVVDKEKLLKLAGEAKSHSLPDFLSALNGDFIEASESRNTTPQMSRSSSRASGSSNLLKYAAYSPPEAIPSISNRRRSIVQQSASGSHLGKPSDANRHRVQHLPPSLPISAGNLAMIDNLSGFPISEVERNASPESKKSWQREAEAPRADLITLESPFQMETAMESHSSKALDSIDDFETVWNMYSQSCDLRGWCNFPMDVLIARLQRIDGHHLRVISPDLDPFIGELKILMKSNKKESSSTSAAVALRLREPEENSCLWRLRCAETGKGEHIQTILNV